jgi:hypothetical protein
MGDVLVTHAREGRFGYDRHPGGFNGKERDSETNLDFFGSGYVSAAHCEVKPPSRS